jgi:GTP pyrophosphokinase
VFAPLANRLGLWQLKWELEDLAFRFLQPDDYRRIASALAEKRQDRVRYITELCRLLEDMMRAAGITGEVYGRPKHIYSIHRKMERKQLSFEQVFDLRAVRIVTERIEDCYAVLGLVHGRFTYVPGEFDDYIATPKDNLYRSIHTAVFGPEGKPVEVQIRTREMHDQAELGLAAHWRYKESRAHDVSYDRKIEWVRKLLDPNEGSGADGTDRDFLDEVRAGLFEDRVYALTPKGEVVDLPPGATSLDFAYHVHTDLGHRCRGARVNGRIVPLTRALANGEIVEIITHKHPQPSRDWLSETAGFLISPRSRSKVRAWFRKLDDESVAEAAPPPIVPATPRAPPRRRSTAKKTPRSPVVLGGVADLPTSFARCCAPVKPEPIAGYATVGRGVTIHRADCAGLIRMSAAHRDRLIAAEWADASAGQPVTLSIVAIDRQGLVRDIGDLLVSEKISIEMMHTTTDRMQSTATIDLRVAIADAPHLTRLLQRLRKVTSVLSVRRSG